MLGGSALIPFFADILFADIPLPNPVPSALADVAAADDALPSLRELEHWSGRLTHTAIVGGIAIGAALLVHFLLFALLRRIAQRSGTGIDNLAVRRLNRSVRGALVVAALAIASAGDPLIWHLWRTSARFLIPGLIGWVLFAAVGMLAEVLLERSAGIEDELEARSRRTKVALLSRIAGVVVIFVTIAMMMLGIPAVRQVGATLIASAGLLGLAVGAAAQPALKSFIAGLHIALTEPIRIGDFVVVEGESGRIEAINFSYVVVRTPDERRVIVPTTKFIDSSFQNWTRVGGITGTVVLLVHTGFAFAPIRAAFEKALASQEDWDKRTGQLQVSEVRVDGVELKLVMSAADPAALARLRLAMREAMLEWLRTEMPDALCGQKV